MTLDDLEYKIVDFMGEMRAEVRNLKDGQKNQGERIGLLDAKVTKHLEYRQGNPNGLRAKATYGGTGAAIIALLELLRHWISQ